MKKKIIIFIGLILVFASVVLNGYWVAGRVIDAMKQKAYRQGINDTVNSIVAQIQNTGEVRLNIDEQQIILIPRQKVGE